MWWTGGLLTQVNYSENHTFGTLQMQSLNTGGLKDRFDCIWYKCSDPLLVVPGQCLYLRLLTYMADA